MTNNLLVVDAQVGAGGDDTFELKFSIEECHNLFELVSNSSEVEEGSNDARGSNASSSPHSSAKQYWLSYRCFGKVIQSELFSMSDGPCSAAFMQTFRVKFTELTSYFSDTKNHTLRIHLCTEGNVIATAFVDFDQLIMLDKEVVLDALKMRNEYTFKPRVKEADEETTSAASVAVALSLDKQSVASAIITDQQQKLLQQQLPLPQTSAETQTSSVPTEELSSKQIKKEAVKAEEEAIKIHDEVKEESENKRDGINDTQCRREAQLLEREAQLQMREEQVSKREQQLQESLTSLENRRLEWEQSKHKEQLVSQERLRNKEAEMLGALEERIMLNEKERLDSMEKARSEYEQLEQRLSKAILDVEAKDRTLKEQQGSYQHEYNRKLAELELKEKLIKQEMKHTVEIEKAKAQAAFEQAVLAKKEAAAAAKKVKLVETEMDELREKHRKTPEALLVQQIAEMKGQLAESERRIEAIKAEKNQILQDKEKFRINVKQLAKALRQERDKAVKRKEESHQNVRLSCDSSGQFVLGGEESEVQRILQDLSKLTQQQDTLESNQGSPVPLPLPSRPLGMDEVLDSNSLGFLNEAKPSNK